MATCVRRYVSLYSTVNPFLSNHICTCTAQLWFAAVHLTKYAIDPTIIPMTRLKSRLQLTLVRRSFFKYKYYVLKRTNLTLRRHFNSYNIIVILGTITRTIITTFFFVFLFLNVWSKYMNKRRHHDNIIYMF